MKILFILPLCTLLCVGCASELKKTETRTIQSKTADGSRQDSLMSSHEGIETAQYLYANSKDGLLPGQEPVPAKNSVTLDKTIKYRLYHIEVMSEKTVVFLLTAKFKTTDCNKFFIMDGEIKEIKSKTESDSGTRNLFADFSIAKTEMGCDGNFPLRTVNLRKEFLIEPIDGGVFATLIVPESFELIRKN